MKDYGIGGTYQKIAQATAAALQGLAGGDMTKALAGASAPNLAQMIKDVAGEDNEAARIGAHAVLGAVLSHLQGNSAAAGGIGALSGELAAIYIKNSLYPNIETKDLTEAQKQVIVNLSSLAAGLSGGLVGDSTGSAVAGAQAGKNAVENNFLLQMIAPPSPVAGQTPQSEANAAIAQKLDVAVKEFGKDAVTKCLSGGDCPMAAQVAILAIQTMMGRSETGPSNTGGDQMAETGPTNTGGNQLPDQSVNHTGNNNGQTDSEPNNTGGNQTVDTSPNNTGNTEAIPDLPNHMTSDGYDNGAEKPSNIKVADDKFLKNNGVDAHQIKKDFLGAKAEIKLYDIYVDKDSGQLWIFRKGGKGEDIPTGEFINK
ncbi:hemagglutinin-like secreted protein [Yersinia frederiksenii]|nr:hemagglutinin-like secreted protein [Yersinia frederiksenii]